MRLLNYIYLLGGDMKENWIDILQFIVSAGGLFFIVKQLKLSRKDYISRFQYQKREKAIELAKEFEILLEKTAITTEVISKTKISQIMKNIEVNKKKILLEDFDSLELNEKISLPNKELSMAYYKNFFSEISDEKLKEIFYSYDISYTEKEKAISFIIMQIFKNLNTLESMSMHFIADIADDEIVYQSLHQVFFSYVEANYILISIINSKGGKDKYYTNVIALYKKWKKRYFEDLENEEKKLKEIHKKEINHSKI